MPTVIHEAPLVVLREEPALVPILLRESLGIEVPRFTTVDVGDASFTQAVPAELRADLVVQLRGDPPAREPVMGVVVEIQRARDDDKRRSWPLYVAALHARLRCPTCLVVIATDDATARWAATPIESLQPLSPFVPLVLGPHRIPRVARARAAVEPWMAVLSAIVHGNRPDGLAATLTGLAALPQLSGEQAQICYDLIRASLGEAASRALEDAMPPSNYEYQSDFARHYFGEGQAKGRSQEAHTLLLTLADRHGAIGDDLRARVTASTDLEQLRNLALAIADARDRAAVEQLLGQLPVPPRAGD